MTRLFKATLIVVALCFVAMAGSDGKCRALVFAATTDAGAYHAGVLDGLLKNAANLSDFAYDIVTGSSVGGFNAAIFAQYETGQETQASQTLLNLWSSITRDDVYQYWAGGYVEGLLFQTSLVDSSPFSQYLQNNLQAPFKRKAVIGVSNADNGDFITYNETNLLNIDDLVTVVKSSSAIPMYFPYVDYGAETYFDGSLIIATDLEDAINRCFEVVSSQSDIIVDVISSHNGHPVNVNDDNYNTLQVLQRALEIFLYATENFQYYLSRLDYPEVNFRYFIQPSTSLPGSFNPLGFDPENMATDIAIGQQDGAAAIQLSGKFGNGAERIEQAVEWLHKNHGMFSKGMEKVKAINKRLRERQMQEL